MLITGDVTSKLTSSESVNRRPFFMLKPRFRWPIATSLLSDRDDVKITAVPCTVTPVIFISSRKRGVPAGDLVLRLSRMM